MDVIIRCAKREDCSQIRELIQELANFENMPEGPVIDAKKLEHDGFDKEKTLYECLIAEDKASPGILIGYTIFNMGYSVRKGKYIYLEDIMVTKKYQGAGIGTKLLSQVCKIFKDGYNGLIIYIYESFEKLDIIPRKEAVIRNCSSVHFAVLGWNPAVDFYAHFQAQDVTKSSNCHYYVMEKNVMIKNAQRYCQETCL